MNDRDTRVVYVYRRSRIQEKGRAPTITLEPIESFEYTRPAGVVTPLQGEVGNDPQFDVGAWPHGGSRTWSAAGPGASRRRRLRSDQDRNGHRHTHAHGL